MTLTIDNETYHLYFGLDFINYLDKKYTIEQNGFKIGQGLTYAIALIEMANPVILVDLILAATCTEGSLKENQVKKYLENEADIEELMNDFLHSLQTSSTTKFTMKKLGLLPNNMKPKQANVQLTI